MARMHACGVLLGGDFQGQGRLGLGVPVIQGIKVGLKTRVPGLPISENRIILFISFDVTSIMTDR